MKKTRLCIDFKELNKIVVPQSQPFPLIEDLMVKTVNCKYFSTLDINYAFSQFLLIFKINTELYLLYNKVISNEHVSHLD